MKRPIPFDFCKRFPFDWRTPCGYLAGSFAQCAGIMSSATVHLQFICVMFGSCWLFIVFAEDIITDVAAFNAAIATETSAGKRAKLTKRFCALLQTYSDVKECVAKEMIQLFIHKK